ncbi:sugar-binding domain-containing protein [Microbacterium elymi]|uniref:Beta-mannosidase-like galactose-binding domain-containing protein n=1 Tax=Microbacterium elymi TaxID=2909587 RepID=A0ABY5NN80_9MICO|nr:sugar-binding domain-containing protein [Microbacterium elymi]UUT36666.1 hypothetical protein L2X98_30145 [Microbacterium elymi]
MLEPDESLWYRRTFTVDPAADERVLLHFGAVDQSCRVAVDGTEVGGHTGGYLPFTLDVTAALADRQGHEHELIVAVRDVTDAAWLARGKQSRRRGGIWYTPQSGIWQTVWLETVPRIAVDALVLTRSWRTGCWRSRSAASMHRPGPRPRCGSWRTATSRHPLPCPWAHPPESRCRARSAPGRRMTRSSTTSR